MPDKTPTLNTTYYDQEINTASTYPPGDKEYSSSQTISGVTYVNGDIEIANEAVITVTGTATLVATGKIIVGNETNIGDNLTLIADDIVQVKNDLSIGQSGILYSSTTIEVGNNCSIGGIGTNEGSRFVTPGDLKIGNNSTIYGLFYADKSTEIGNNLDYSGMIITGYLKGVGENAILELGQDVYDWDSLGDVSYGSGEEEGITVINWDEVY